MNMAVTPQQLRNDPRILLRKGDPFASGFLKISPSNLDRHLLVPQLFNQSEGALGQPRLM